MAEDANTLAVEFSDEVGHRLELRIAEVVDDVMVVQFRHQSRANESSSP